MAAPSFDLVDIIRTIQKRKMFILAVTLAAALIGGLFMVVKKKKYISGARFLVNNPLYGDRNTLFRSYETRYVDYFGGDDDLDKITALANSDTVKDRIIRNCQFDVIYRGGDINDPKAHAYYMSIFNKNFNLKRSEYKDLEVSYIAYDPQAAANVSNMAVQVLEETYRHYYTAMKSGLSLSISDKMVQLDSSIAALTDTLAGMRDKYGIYSIISPARQGSMMSGDIKGNGGPGLGRAIEELQNVESVKDQLVADRAHYISLLNEFSAAASPSIGYLKMITRALPPTAPYGPSLLMTILAATFLGFFFSIALVLLMAYYRKLNAVIR